MTSMDFHEFNVILDPSRNPTSPSSASSCAQGAQHSAKMMPTWSETLPKSSQDGAQSLQNGANMGPRLGQDSEKIKEKRQRIKKEGCTSQRCRSQAENVTNMVPTWGPKWSQDSQQIHPEIDHFLMPHGIAFCVDLIDFGYQNGAKMIPK